MGKVQKEMNSFQPRQWNEAGGRAGGVNIYFNRIKGRGCAGI